MYRTNRNGPNQPSLSQEGGGISLPPPSSSLPKKRKTRTKPYKEDLGFKESPPARHVHDPVIKEDMPANRGGGGEVPTDIKPLDFCPHPKQVIVLEAIDKIIKLPGFKIVMVRAGVREGKTFGMAYTCHTLKYKYKLMPNLAYIVSPTNNMARIPRRMYASTAGDNLVTEKRASDAGPAHFLMKPFEGLVDHKGNAQYYIVEQHTGEYANRMRGATIAWAWLDEYQEAKSEVLDVLLGRLAENDGILLMSGTASYPAHWSETEVANQAYKCGICGKCVYDHYDLKLENGEPIKGWVWVQKTQEWEWKETREYIPKDHEPANCTGDPNIAIIECSTFDNTQISHAAFKQLEAKYALKDPVIARRELYGEPAGFEGLVYTAFSRKLHATHFTVNNIPPEAKIVAGIDFGVQDPFVVSFWAKTGEVWHGFAEYYYTGPVRTISEHVKEIKKIIPGSIMSRVKTYWCDPSDPQQRAELKKEGIRGASRAPRRNLQGRNWLTYRIDIMTQLLKGVASDGSPLLRMNSVTMPKTVKDFEGRKWKRHQSIGEDGRVRIIDTKGKQVDRNAGDEPAKGNDHGTDSAEYCLCSEYVSGSYAIHNRLKSAALSHMNTKDIKPTPQGQNLSEHLAQGLNEKIRRLKGKGRKGLKFKSVIS